MSFGYDPAAHVAIGQLRGALGVAHDGIAGLLPYLPTTTPDWVRADFARLVRDLADARMTTVASTNAAADLTDPTHPPLAIATGAQA